MTTSRSIPLKRRIVSKRTSSGSSGTASGASPLELETPNRSRRGGVVLVDEPAEQISSANVVRTDGDRIPRFGSWRGEAEGAMGSPAVVVLGMGPERAVEMPPTSG